MISDLAVKIAKKLLRKRGFTVIDKRTDDWSGQDFVLSEYKNGDGTFDYEGYRKVQNEGNQRKIDLIWADKDTIDFLADYLSRKLPSVTRGLCHGTRRGEEQRWFSEKLGVEVIGTDIGDSATSFPNTVQWDFHETLPDWVRAFDFVYTNSHDHAYDPKKAFDAWVDQLKPGGVLLIEHSVDHSEIYTSKLDPFGASLKVMPYLILKWGEGRYAVSEILEPPFLKRDRLKSWVLVVRRAADG